MYITNSSPLPVDTVLLFLFYSFFFFFNDTATTEIYTLSLHDALPILPGCGFEVKRARMRRSLPSGRLARTRSEEHTSELQSRFDLVCRLLLEKKKKKNKKTINICNDTRKIIILYI